MAGSVLISPVTTWTVGVHGFYPIVDRIRTQFPCADVAEEIFSTIDQGFDLISLSDLSAEHYMEFYRIASRSYQTFINEESDGTSAEYRAGINKCWSELLSLLEKDPRFQHG